MQLLQSAVFQQGSMSSSVLLIMHHLWQRFGYAGLPMLPDPQGVMAPARHLAAGRCMLHLHAIRPMGDAIPGSLRTAPCFSCIEPG